MDCRLECRLSQRLIWCKILKVAKMLMGCQKYIEIILECIHMYLGDRTLRQLQPHSWNVTLHVTRITQAWATTLCALLVLFSSFREHDHNREFILLVTVLCGIKGPRPTLTMADQHFTTYFHNDIIHQVQCFPHPMMAQIINNAGPHHLQARATSSSRALSRGLQWNLHQNPQETGQDLGFKISFQPRWVHL